MEVMRKDGEGSYLSPWRRVEVGHLGIFECRVVLWVIHFFKCKRVGAEGSGKVKFWLQEKQEFSSGFTRFKVFVRFRSENCFNISLSDIRLFAVCSPKFLHCM